MYHLLFLLLFKLSSPTSLSGAEPYYHKVTPKPGDGVFSLLRRYDLAKDACNILQFYKLNRMAKNEALIKGKKYFIPVLIYKYNGKSIRSTIGNDDFEKALSIQRYNEFLLNTQLRKSSYRSSKILWVPFSAIYCGNVNTMDEVVVAETNLPSTDVQTRTESLEKTESKPIINTDTKPKSASKIMKSDPLFGKLASYQEVDQSLKNKVYFIVSGHGGPDPGAMCTTCPSSLCEDEYAYDVALRLARNLKQHGANVEIIIQDKNDGIRAEKYLKCDKDEKCMGDQKIPLNQKARLAQRTNNINRLAKEYRNKGITEQIAVFVHVDSNSKGKRKDVFFYHHVNSKRGKAIANNIHTTFEAKYARFQKGRGYKGTVTHRNLYVIRNTHPPAVFIELANIKNPKDQQRIILDTNRQAVANWIFLGLIK